ncbi:MAG: tryptophan halogenase family protein [Pseudomonadota bacterium]
MVKSIVIAGGGSAGWMTAAYLSKHLDGVDITLIESSDIPVVGVGESTITPIVQFMNAMGLEETDWMPQCNATYKSAIGFKNFHRVGDPHMWYTFEPMAVIEGRPMSRYWYRQHLADDVNFDRFSFYDYCYVGPELCRQGKTLRSMVDKGPAYHLDAGLLGELLSRIGISNGVTRVIDDIRGVKRHEDGRIAALERENGPDLEADLFIDCTGFRALLMDGALEEPFNSYNESLFNDKAIAIRYPYEDPDREMFSYTNCTAQSSGWIWQIPLYHRVGSGYVYSSAHKSPDEAELELRQFIGEERTKDLDTNHINIRVGKHRRTWVKNCVAIGLASGFIEPLESTGLLIVQVQIESLARTIAAKNDFNAGDRAVYNQITTDLYEGIRDFLVCHYALTEREDSAYWRDVKFNTVIPDSAAERMRLARMALLDVPMLGQFERPNFGDYSFTDGWQAILIGMNHMPLAMNQFQNVGPNDPVVVQNMAQAEQRRRQMERFKVQEMARFPSHYEYLSTHIHQPEPLATAL